MLECDGNCEVHRGDVHRVHVSNISHDWGEFNYCEAAIEHDKAIGFDVLHVGDENDDE